MRVCRDDFETGSGLALSYRWGLGLIPSKSKYINLWWIKRHSKKFISEYFCSLLSLSSHRCSVIYFIHLPKTLCTCKLSGRRHHRIKHFFLCVSVSLSSLPLFVCLGGLLMFLKKGGYQSILFFTRWRKKLVQMY